LVKVLETHLPKRFPGIWLTDQASIRPLPWMCNCTNSGWRPSNSQLSIAVYSSKCECRVFSCMQAVGFQTVFALPKPISSPFAHSQHLTHLTLMSILLPFPIVLECPWPVDRGSAHLDVGQCNTLVALSNAGWCAAAQEIGITPAKKPLPKVWGEFFQFLVQKPGFQISYGETPRFLFPGGFPNSIIHRGQWTCVAFLIRQGSLVIRESRQMRLESIKWAVHREKCGVRRECQPHLTSN
jgi:hypothetical protein